MENPISITHRFQGLFQSGVVKEPFDSCDLCGGRNFSLVFPEASIRALASSDRYRSSSNEFCAEQVLKCRNCELVAINPKREIEEIQGGYSDAEDPDYVSQREPRIATFRKIFQKLRPFLPERGRALDIGAGAGFFLVAAKEQGWDVQGIELSRWLAGYGKREFGIDIQSVPLEKAGFPAESFDLITLWDVIEHVPSPLKTLQEVHRLLKPGGTLALSTPDWGSLSARVLRRRWWFFLSVHLYYFTSRTMKAVLKKAGFHPVNESMYFQSLRLGYLFERLKQYLPRTGATGRKILEKVGAADLPVPYYAAQRMFIAKK